MIISTSLLGLYVNFNLTNSVHEWTKLADNYTDESQYDKTALNIYASLNI